MAVESLNSFFSNRNEMNNNKNIYVYGLNERNIEAVRDEISAYAHATTNQNEDTTNDDEMEKKKTNSEMERKKNGKQFQRIEHTSHHN